MNRLYTIAMLLIAIAAPSWACPDAAKMSATKHLTARAAPPVRQNVNESLTFEDMPPPIASAAGDAMQRDSRGATSKHPKQRLTVHAPTAASKQGTDSAACPGDYDGCLPFGD